MSTTIKRIRRSLRDCRFKPSLRLDLFEEEYCLDLFGFLFALPILDRWHREPEEMMESWGVYYHERSVVLCWGPKTKFIHMPWEMVHIKCEVLRPDGTWAKEVNSWDKGEPDGREVQVHDYIYTLRSGEVQHRKATCHVERREWRQKWLRWTRLFAKIRTYLEIQFDGEVGERTGSWKGGCIGCGYDMRRGESMESCLRRMEAERKF